RTQRRVSRLTRSPLAIARLCTRRRKALAKSVTTCCCEVIGIRHYCRQVVFDKAHGLGQSDAEATRFLRLEAVSRTQRQLCSDSSDFRGTAPRHIQRVAATAPASQDKGGRRAVPEQNVNAVACKYVRDALSHCCTGGKSGHDVRSLHPFLA